MPAQDFVALITKAKSGQLDAVAALIEAVARDLRAFIATYAATPAMVEEAHTATWIQVRKELATCPPSAQAITWIRQRAIGVLKGLLEDEGDTAIAARDGLRHLVVQDGLEGLQALVSPSNEGATLLNQRYAALDEADQLLLSRRYGDGADLASLAGELGCGDGEAARRLGRARSGLHWRATDADRKPVDDPQVAIAIDLMLSGTLDPAGRQALGTTLMKDLGRAASFTRQVRIDLMLRAVFGAYTQEQARQLASTLAKIEHKRRNESSLLQVVAPPRTPVGSGSELRQTNERIGNRQAGVPGSGGAVTASTRPVARAGSRRRGGSDENLLATSRGRRNDNRQTMLIGGAIAAVGLIALVVLWGRGGATAVEAGGAGDGSAVATVLSTGGGAQVLSGQAQSPAQARANLLSGQGLDSARGETALELSGSGRVVLLPGTVVTAITALPDRTGQVQLGKGTLQLNVTSPPGVEVRTAQGRITFGIGRGTIICETDRTLVQAQGGSITAVGAAGGSAMQVLPDKRVEILAGGPARALQATGFVRGINFGGTPVTIDRRRWLSHREALSAGLTLGTGTGIAPQAMFAGTGLDFDRKTMLDTGLIASAGTLQFTQQLPDGAYDLTLWLANTAGLEEARLSVSVNGTPLKLSGTMLKRDTWALIGPLPVRASQGRLELQFSGQGNARVSGMALEAPGGDALALPAAVVLTSPIEAATFFTTDKVTLRAEVVGKVKAVQFLSGDQLLGEATSEPYHLAVPKLEAGEKRITARALNLTGEPSVSLPLSFSVVASFGTGTILQQRWRNQPGSMLSEGKDDGRPDESVELKDFTTRVDFDDEYYCRLRGYVHPPLTGDYVFWMVSDDEGELRLSPSADPAQAKRIAYSENATGIRDWTKNDSQQSKPVSLIAGQRYYIELRYKEHKGSDLGACGWRLPNGVLDRPIPGAHLSPFKP